VMSKSVSNSFLFLTYTHTVTDPSSAQVSWICNSSWKELDYNMQSSQHNKLQNNIKLGKTRLITKKRTLQHDSSKQHMHYKVIKPVKYEYSYIYTEKVSRIKNIKKEHKYKIFIAS
jgi:hypothetical protein